VARDNRGVELSDVIAHAGRFEDTFYLATVSSRSQPHVVPLTGGWQDGALYATVAVDGRAARNLVAQPRCCAHYQVSEESGWDSLMLWGRGSVLTAVEDKRRLWPVIPYDMDEWDPGGPDGSPDTAFLEIVPRRALLLRRYGLDGREEWRAG
jgi:nitroimidazol reductase NimA-like FMN-containing flavoprotein (pyridoxamine 5'-phosphate oxidase superfamily)